ncbi:uncharacterized protein LOC129720354 [Wyeomyia smithii]|uniref:uncharacterized protein LOC129720354 n=1 Tax=Wyeomyia smithii TaxID=174621 RepID=UPI002467BEC7|nr:uncharacterized protein LOC129720354 [Wyeomyia smithii]
MKVVQFSLPDNFEPKEKLQKAKKMPRCLWVSPDTLFVMCEIALRRLLLPPAVPRHKFWSTVISLLPNGIARSRVRHQVEFPGDFNLREHATVNYANHWKLLTATIQRQHPKASNIRVGSLVRNQITRLLLELDQCSSSGSDCLQTYPSCQQSTVQCVQLPFPQKLSREAELSDEFIAQTARANMQSMAASVGRNIRGIWCRYCTCDQYHGELPPFYVVEKDLAVQQLMIMGQAKFRQTARSSCRQQSSDFAPCSCCQTKM